MCPLSVLTYCTPGPAPPAGPLAVTFAVVGKGFEVAVPVFLGVFVAIRYSAGH